MRIVNVMLLAWKIFKGSNLITKFSFALKLAWKIAKHSSITLENNIIKIVSKTIKDMKLYVAKNTGKNKIEFVDDEYNFNLFSYEVQRNF